MASAARRCGSGEVGARFACQSEPARPPGQNAPRHRGNLSLPRLGAMRFVAPSRSLVLSNLKHPFVMAELVGNVLVGQSGGPTAVINASVAGIISEALNHECIEEIYGALNGVLGILQEDLIDLASESQQQ